MKNWFKQFCMRYIPTEVLAWLHGRRFARLVHKLKQDPEMALLNKFLKPGDVAVDVGANGANWTWFLSRAVGPKGHILAFEADPYYVRATDWAIRHMRPGNTTLFPFGLSNRAETVYLRTVGDTGGQTEIVPFKELQFSPVNEVVQEIAAMLRDKDAQQSVLQKLEGQKSKFSTDQFCEQVRQIVDEWFDKISCLTNDFSISNR